MAGMLGVLGPSWDSPSDWFHCYQSGYKCWSGHSVWLWCTKDVKNSTVVTFNITCHVVKCIFFLATCQDVGAWRASRSICLPIGPGWIISRSSATAVRIVPGQIAGIDIAACLARCLCSIRVMYASSILRSSTGSWWNGRPCRFESCVSKCACHVAFSHEMACNSRASVQILNQILGQLINHQLILPHSSADLDWSSIASPIIGLLRINQTFGCEQLVSRWSTSLQVYTRWLKASQQSATCTFQSTGFTVMNGKQLMFGPPDHCQIGVWMKERAYITRYKRQTFHTKV